MLALALVFLFADVPQPRLELRAEPTSLYPGQMGRLEVFLHLPPSFGPEAKPPRLILPWLEGEMEGLHGQLEPDAWLTSTVRQRREGTGVALGPAAWAWPQDKNDSTLGDHVHRLVWRFRCRPEQEGTVAVPPAALVWPDGRKLLSAPLAIVVKPLPLPDRPQPAWRLGVGRFTVRGELAPTTLQPGEEAELRLWVGGEGALAEIKPPLLARLPGWGLDRFRVTAMPETWSDDRSQRCFRWRVQIRGDVGPVTLPAIPFGFFDPGEGRFAVNGVPRLAATLAAHEFSPKEAPTPLAEVPERLRLANAEEALAVADGFPGPALMLIVVGVWVLEFIASLFLRDHFGWPDAPATAVRRAEARRAWKAGRRALQDERLPLPLRAEAALRAIGLHAEEATPAMAKLDQRQPRAAALRRAVEAAQYGPPGACDIDLRTEAMALLDDWKEAACS